MTVAGQSVTLAYNSPSLINAWPMSITCSVERWLEASADDVTITYPDGRTCARFQGTTQTCELGDCPRKHRNRLIMAISCNVDGNGKGKATLTLALRWLGRLSSGNWSCNYEGNISSVQPFEVRGKHN